MAIAQMTKVMIVTHRDQASDLLEALQHEGICQVLNAEQAMVSKDMPDLVKPGERPTDIEALISRLQNTVTFLNRYSKAEKSLASVLAPRTVIDENTCNAIVADVGILDILAQAEQVETSIEKTKGQIDNLRTTLGMLEPWIDLDTPVEEIGRSDKTTSWLGIIPNQQLEQLEQKVAELGIAIQQVGAIGNRICCVIVALNEDLEEVQKLLRSAEFEAVSFEPMRGTVAELINQHSERLEDTERYIRIQTERAEELSKNLLKLQVLYDHYSNLLSREQAKDTAPATEYTVVLEGWVRRRDFKRLQEIVENFRATSLTKAELAEGENIPVEIDNKPAVRPFEVITRLYGMPRYFELDPTKYLAPFFAIFFALCLTDAGYGLVIIALMIFLIKKLQGDKKLMWMLGICSAVTLVAGALTGGWFGDAIQQFVPALKPLREKMLWFDPFEKPMMFFALSLALGYIQIQVGLLIAFIYYIRRRDFIAALCDKLTWLIMLNSLVLYGAGKSGVISPQLGTFFGRLALVPAIVILLFSHREGPVAGRIGMGAYNLFSTIFYVGDVLSYLRLMALGMVTAGIAMAVNVIAKISIDIPYGIGIIVMILVLVGGHAFNIAMSGLGAFVHTLRLQYVEFFPKFFAGGGRQFEPLAKKYKHIYIKTVKEA